MAQDRTKRPRRRRKRGYSERDSNLLKKYGSSKKITSRTDAVGSKKPLIYENYRGHGLDRFYDTELQESVVRNPEIGTPLVEMFNTCPEVATAIYRISDHVWASPDGDSRSFVVAPLVEDEEIDPEVKDILDRLIAEVLPRSMNFLSNQLLAYGDFFCNIAFDRNAGRIYKIIPLPCWEMFRIEDFKGDVECFEQRSYLGAPDHDIIKYPAYSIVHWRFRYTYGLYGSGLFESGIGYWKRLKAVLNDLDRALVEIGTNPNVHQFKCDTPDPYIKDYKDALAETRSRSRAINDYFIKDGTITKLASSEPTLTALFQAQQLYTDKIIMTSCVPGWMLNSLSNTAQDLNNGPAMAFNDFVNNFRGILSEGLKKIFDFELFINGIPEERQRYKLEWPKLKSSAFDNVLSPELNQEQEAKSLDEPSDRDS